MILIVLTVDGEDCVVSIKCYKVYFKNYEGTLPPTDNTASTLILAITRK